MIDRQQRLGAWSSRWLFAPLLAALSLADTRDAADWGGVTTSTCFGAVDGSLAFLATGIAFPDAAAVVASSQIRETLVELIAAKANVTTDDVDLNLTVAGDSEVRGNFEVAVRPEAHRDVEDVKAALALHEPLQISARFAFEVKRRMAAEDVHVSVFDFSTRVARVSSCSPGTRMQPFPYKSMLAVLSGLCVASALCGYLGGDEVEGSSRSSRTPRAMRLDEDKSESRPILPAQELSSRGTSPLVVAAFAGRQESAGTALPLLAPPLRSVSVPLPHARSHHVATPMVLANVAPVQLPV